MPDHTRTVAALLARLAIVGAENRRMHRVIIAALLLPTAGAIARGLAGGDERFAEGMLCGSVLAAVPVAVWVGRGACVGVAGRHGAAMREMDEVDKERGRTW